MGQATITPARLSLRELAERAAEQQRAERVLRAEQREKEQAEMTRLRTLDMLRNLIPPGHPFHQMDEGRGAGGDGTVEVDGYRFRGGGFGYGRELQLVGDCPRCGEQTLSGPIHVLADLAGDFEPYSDHWEDCTSPPGANAVARSEPTLEAQLLELLRRFVAREVAAWSP